MAILITGGTGFVGAELARILVSKGEDVILFDIAPNYARISDIRDKVKVVRGDLANLSEVLNLVRDNNVKGIYHLGGMLSVPSNANPWASFQVNVVGTVNILEAARLFSVSKVVFTSTLATYGLDCSRIITDTTLQRPTTMYGCGKLYCECLGRFYSSRFGLDFRSVRFASIIGPGVRTPGVAQWNAWIIEYPALGKPFECYVTGDIKCPVIYFKDAARSIDMVYQASKEQIKTVNYNVAGVVPTRSAREIEQVVKKYIPGAQISYKPDTEAMNYFRTSTVDVFDDSRAREEWGWYAMYPDFDKVVVDFIEEIHNRPERYGIV